jgi:negative regulator of replication initiation
MMGSVDKRENESELYRKIISRAKQVRERAAESLRRTRASRKKERDSEAQTVAAQKRRGFRQHD